MEEQAVSRAFDKARHCQILLASAGPLNESALLFKHGYLTDGDLANLRQRGAVGDVLGRFVDPNGDQVHYFLDDRLMSLELDDMRNIQFRVLIGGGQDKIAPMRAVSKSGLFNVLITDLQTAQALMMAS
jgi:deoxyribonucleoside regulator